MSTNPKDYKTNAKTRGPNDQGTTVAQLSINELLDTISGMAAACRSMGNTVIAATIDRCVAELREEIGQPNIQACNDHESLVARMAHAIKTVQQLGTDKASLSAEIKRLRAALDEIGERARRCDLIGAPLDPAGVLKMTNAALSETNGDQQ